MTFAIHLIDKQRSKKGVIQTSLKEKFRHYRNSVFVRLALMEATNIFALVITLIEGKVHFVIYFLIGIAAFLFFKPSEARFMEEYNVVEENIK